MTKIRFLFVFAAIVFATSLAQLAAQVSTWDGTHTPWTHGTGTEGDPFLIENAQQLAYLTYRVNNGLDAAGGHVSNSDYHYKLMTDVDLNGSEDFQWTPIGYYTSSTEYQCFGGHFDGNNHTISSVYINSSTLSYVGLFGYTDGASVSNLAVSGTTVSSTKSNSYAGGIIGKADNTIDIANCSSNFSSDISSINDAGGIVGCATTITITNCYNTGNVNSNSDNPTYSGGILGYADIATITNCYNTGSVNSTSNYSNCYSGGILGHASVTTINNSYNLGTVTALCLNNLLPSNVGSYCGGIIGYVSSTNTAITNCYNIGSVCAQSRAITNSNNSNSVNSNYSGGIIGKNNGNVSIMNCYNTGDVSSISSNNYYYLNNYSGGIVGYGNNIYVTNNYNTGNITCTTSYNNNYTGGIVGYGNNNNNIANCFYLNTCGGNNTYGGQPMSADAMRSTDFLGMLANGSCAWAMDTEPFSNDGYPVLTMIETSAQTYDASNITQTRVSLRGKVSATNDEIISAGFMYKRSDAENFTTVTCNAVADTMIYALTGLLPNTSYTYKTFLQTTGCGTIYGEEKTFTTLPISITTLNATDIGQTSATLNGSFDVGDASGTWGFQYKAESETNYHYIEVTETGNVSISITGLIVNTAYAYRTFFSQAGTDSIFGTIQTFRTIPPWDGTYSPWTQGSGTEDDPYLIENAQHLAYLAYRVNNGLENNSKYYKVVADIDLYGSEDFLWTPIGIMNHAFSGHFDGGNHTIYGLYVSGETHAGLFGYASEATIKNTNVRGIRVSGLVPGYVAGIVGYANYTDINNCSNSCNISGGSVTGGIVGRAVESTIKNCYNKGNISGGTTTKSSSGSGGIAGSAIYSTIANCFNTGFVTAQGTNDTFENGWGGSSYYYIMAGGILGGGGNFFVVENCYSTGCCSATNYYSGGRSCTGAIVGYCAHYGVGSYWYSGYQTYENEQQQQYNNRTVNCAYLETCNISNIYGGTAMSSEAMQNANFVDLLNGNSCVWQQDIEPFENFENDGYPTLSTLLYYAYTESATEVADVSATLHGHIEISNATVISKGFEYKKANESEYTVVNVTTEGNTLTSHLSGLDSNTTYEYRAFVKVAECEYPAYGENMQFTVSYLNADTIPIYDIEMLQWVADMCNQDVTFEGKYIKLMNNIVLPLNQPNNMSSIGSYPDHPFKGTFDGNGKLITNLYIDQPNTPYQGFFGYTLDANLYNVGLVNITASGRNYTGGMVAYAENTNMRDCYVNGGTLFALSYCGGLVGYQTPGTNSIISGCYNTCTVSGNHYVGGLLGYSDYGTVRNSYVAASVAAQGDAVGSIIGGANEVLMYQCYFSSEITGQENAIGENNFKSNEGMTNEQMRDPQFVETLNQGLTIPVWKGDYEQPINNGFPILKWQYSEIETCGAPENLTSIINGNNITLIWTGEENVDYYIVEYGLAGEQAQTETTTRNTISFIYEQPGSYYWRVKSVCPFGESNFVNGENVEIVGVEEFAGIQQIGIYPNPASESVTIQCDGQNGLEQINIFDVNGRIVMSELATGQIHRLDVSNLQQGIYFVKVLTSDGYMTNKKLIVQ